MSLVMIHMVSNTSTNWSGWILRCLTWLRTHIHELKWVNLEMFHMVKLHGTSQDSSTSWTHIHELKWMNLAIFHLASNTHPWSGWILRYSTWRQTPTHEVDESCDIPRGVKHPPMKWMNLAIFHVASNTHPWSGWILEYSTWRQTHIHEVDESYHVPYGFKHTSMKRAKWTVGDMICHKRIENARTGDC